MQLGKTLDKNPIVLGMVQKEYYNETIFEALRQMKDRRICYVSLNKPAKTLHHAFALHNVPMEKMFFIDTVSQGLGQDNGEDNVLFCSSPAALTELSIAIGEALKSGAFDALFFDSLSTLNIYDLGSSAERFTGTVITKLQSGDDQGLFTCLEDDQDTPLIRTSSMQVDKVVRFPELYGRIDKKRKNTALALLGGIGISGTLMFLHPGGAVTGYVVGGGVSGTPAALLLGFFTLLAVTFMAYRGTLLRPVEKEQLLAMKPAKHDKKKLRSQYHGKISHWLESLECAIF